MRHDVDILNRDSFVDTVVNIVENLEKTKTYVTFSIDGGWGYGKTFVLEKIENCLSEIQSEETKTDKYIVFHYDCWKYDYYDEPLIAFSSALQDMIIEKSSLFDKAVAKKANAMLKFVARKLILIPNAIIKNYFGVDIKESYDEIQEIEKELKSFDPLSNLQDALKKLKDALREIGINKTIIICIDEIDRCLPPYQIKILERLHHLFQGENIISIFSVNRSQLGETVKQLYGGDDKRVDNYLKKFMSFSLSLGKGALDDHIKEKFHDCLSLFDSRFKDEFSLTEFLHSIAPAMDVRKQEKLWEKVKLIHSMVFTEKVGYDILAYELLWFIMQEYKEYYFFNSFTSHPKREIQIPTFELLKPFCKGEVGMMQSAETLHIPRNISNFFESLAAKHSRSISIEGNKKYFSITSTSSLYMYLLAYWLDSCDTIYQCTFSPCVGLNKGAYSQKQYFENLANLRKFRDIARIIEY